MHIKEINKQNELGSKGEVANVYADLLKLSFLLMILSYFLSLEKFGEEIPLPLYVQIHSLKLLEIMLFKSVENIWI